MLLAVDEGVQTTYYGDSDGDGYGVQGVTTQACARPGGYADGAGDCDDDDESFSYLPPLWNSGARRSS